MTLTTDDRRLTTDAAVVARMRCPACGGALTYEPHGADTGRACCAGCGAGWPQVAGIWHMLTPVQRAAYAPFLQSYRALREREGWVRPPAYYLRLPAVARGDPAAWMWAIRRRSLRPLERALPPGRGAWALDVGAGNGWLARRLVRRGYQVIAADLNARGIEGLEGADLYFRHDGLWFGRVQASMDSLPFAGGAFAVCTISGALSYARLRETLHAVARVLQPGGLLLITDSPIYTGGEAGAAMAAEQRARARAHLGYDPAPLPGGAGYLVASTLRAELHAAGFRVRMLPTERLLGRLKRRLGRRLHPGRREEARFPVVAAQKPGGARR